MEFVNEKTLSEYESFVSACPKGHFLQSKKWAGVKDNWKWEGIISRGEDGKIKGTMSVLIRKLPVLPWTIMYSPRGPVCDVHDRDTLSDLMDGARALSKKHKSYVLKLDPDVKSDDSEFVDIMSSIGVKVRDSGKNFEGIQPKYVFRLYLEGRGEEELMASFHQKTRYNIRVAIKNGVTVEIGDRSDVGRFHEIMMETGLRDKFVIRTKEYFEKMLDSLGENARLYVAKYNGKIVAGTLACAYGDKVWYLYGASSNEARNVMPNYLLQMEMMKWAIERGSRIYDFRGVSGDIDESNPLYGLYRFKKGFNGEFTEFVGEMEYEFSHFLNVCVTKGEHAFRKARKWVFMIKNRGKDTSKKN